MSVPYSTLQTSSHVFLSYPRKDRVLVDLIAGDLEREGLRTWIDHRSIEPGTPDWESSIRGAIDQSYTLVLVCTPNTSTSNYVKAELELAKESGCQIIPVWVRGERWTDCVPLGLVAYQRVDLREDRYAGGMLALLSQLRRDAAGRGHAQSETGGGPRPAPSATPEAGHLSLLARQGRVERQVRRVQHQLRIVRPVLGINLPHVNFERDAHYLSRSIEHFELKLPKPINRPEKGKAVTTSDLKLADRLSKEGMHLGLKAEAGMGKSAILEQLAYRCAVLAAQAPAARPLPLLIRLGDVRGRADLIRQVERQLLLEWEGELEAGDLAGCEFIAFIDGLDELPADQDSQWLEKAVEDGLLDLIGEGIEVGRVRLRAKSSILTSRPEGIHRCNLLPHFRSDNARRLGVAPQILELKRFGVRDQATYVRRFFHPYGEEEPGAGGAPGVSQKLIQALQTEGSAARVADTPLLLFLLCYLNSHGAATAELTLPSTAPQLLLAGIRHTRPRRDARLSEAHLTACACLAFEHKMRGALTTEEAAAAVAALCQEDIADPVQGLAARLDIRRAPFNELPTVDRASLSHLVRDVLCARTGLFLLAGEYVRPTDIRVGDVLAAYHLQRLARAHGFGFDHLRKRTEPAATPCILDPHRAAAARETVAQALSRWVWDERKWRNVIHSLAVLLAEAGEAAPLIALLSEADPINGINPLGDDDGGHRLIVAVDCWRLAKTATPGRDDLELLAPVLKAEGPRRRAHHPALSRALERLEGREQYARVRSDNSFDVDEEEPLPTFDDIIERLEKEAARAPRDASYGPLIECLRELKESGAPPGELSVPMLHRLADCMLDARWHSMNYDMLRDTLKILRLDALKHLPFLARVISFRDRVSDRFPNFSVVDILLTTLLEQSLIDAIDDPATLRAVFGLQLDQTLELYHAASKVFTGGERAPVVGIDGRLVTPVTTRVLAEYVKSGLPGGWGTSAQYSAVRLLARLMPSRPGEHGFITQTLCKVLEAQEFQDGFLVLRYISNLAQYELDYDALWRSIFVFADRFVNERNVSVIVHVALYCRARTMPQAALDDVRALISRFSSSRDEILLSVMSFDLDTVSELGMLDAAIDLADTDPDWGASSMYRNAGMGFISRNVDKLIKDDDFVTAVINSVRERGGRFFWDEDIARLVLGASRDAGFAKRLLSLSATAERPQRLVEELVTKDAALLFDTGLRFRRSDDLKSFEWVETTATLAAGYGVGDHQSSLGE